MGAPTGGRRAQCAHGGAAGAAHRRPPGCQGGPGDSPRGRGYKSGKGRGAGAHRRCPAMVGRKCGRRDGASSTLACFSGRRWPLVRPTAWGGGIRSEASPNRGRRARMAALTEEGVGGGGSCMILARQRASYSHLWQEQGRERRSATRTLAKGKVARRRRRVKKGAAR
jgi:hypothetical protein